MGRRRRRVVRIVKKKLPTVFVCPRCGEEAVRVTIAKDTGHATVLCALCSLKDDFPAHPAAQAIDVYSYFTDRFYGVKDPRPIIPHDRLIRAPPTDEEISSVEQASVGLAGNVSEPAPSRELESEKPGLKSSPSITEGTSQLIPPAEASLETVSDKASETSQTESSQEKEAETTAEPEAESKEESEPFADILENKDKKRYSSTPLPQQTSDQTS